MASDFETGSGPWAKDSTIRDLISVSNNQNKLLGLIATAQGVSADQIKNLAGGISTTNREIAGSRRQTEKLLEEAKGTTKVAIKSADSLNSILKNKTAGLKSEFTSAIGGIGEALAKDGKYKGLVAAAELLGTGLETLYNNATALSDATLQAYDSGIVFSGGMHEVAKTMDATGLGLDKFQKVILRNSQVVSAVGIPRLQVLSESFKTLTNRGVDLGTDLEGASQTLLSYIEIQRASGQLTKKDDKELTTGAMAYGKQLNELSQLTGKRRDQLDQEVKEHIKRPRLQIMLSTLTGEARAAAERGIRGLAPLGPMAEKMENLMAGYRARGLAGMQDADANLTQAIVNSGHMNDFMEAYNATMQGNTAKQKEAFTALGSGIQDFVKNRANYNGATQYVMGQQVEAAQELATASTAYSQKVDAAGKDVPNDVKAISGVQQAFAEAAAKFDTALLDLSARIVSWAAPEIKRLGDVAVRAAEGVQDLVNFMGYGDLPRGSDGKIDWSRVIVAGLDIAAPTAAAIGGAAITRRMLAREGDPGLGDTLHPEEDHESRMGRSRMRRSGARRLSGGLGWLQSLYLGTEAGLEDQSVGVGAATTGGGLVGGAVGERTIGAAADKIAQRIASDGSFKKAIIAGLISLGGHAIGQIGGTELGAMTSRQLAEMALGVGPQQSVAPTDNNDNAGGTQYGNTGPVTTDGSTPASQPSGGASDMRQTNGLLQQMVDKLDALISTEQSSTRTLSEAYARGQGVVH